MQGNALQLRDRQAVNDRDQLSACDLQVMYRGVFLRTRFHLLASLFSLALLACPIAAKDYPVKVIAARIGLPSSGKASEKDDPTSAPHITKFAAWAPVYVEVELNAAIAEPLEIAIESADPDEISTTLTVPLNLANFATGTRIAAADLGTIGYLRPAGVGEATIVVRVANGGREVSEPFRIRSLRPRDSLAYVVLALGSHIPGFELPKPAVATPEQAAGHRGGRVEFTELTSTNQLPNQWFGYETADLVILNTGSGSDEMLNRLFGDKATGADLAKRKALIEWVERGGRLLVSVGSNASLVSRLPALQELLPFVVNATQPNRKPGALALSWVSRGESSRTSTMNGALQIKGGNFPVANLIEGTRPAQILIPTRDRLKSRSDAVAAQWPHGLGRITVLAFDLDRPPFTDFSERAEFWDWALRDAGANRASAGSEGRSKASATGPSEEEDELAVALRSHIDTFDGVPVVSFGWIAILIVLYILLIGPVEYFFLKRVLGRLELTWITFPIIVFTVSLAAYLSAHSLKGRDLKIDKLDVVDVDPASGRVYGTTWFTIFSPRIENYTLGVTPAEGWSAEADPPGTTVSWVGAPRGGRASLLRRSYRYHEGEDGLEDVPIQVWSTKSFIANWSANSPSSSVGAKPAASGLVESHLEHPPADPAAVIGTFVNRLPIPLLSDCVAFYAGQAYPLPGGTIHSGETIRLVLDKGILATQWLQKESRLEEILRRVPSYLERPGASKVPLPPTAARGGTNAFDDSFTPWGVLFHEAALTYGEGVIPRNASLRWLDQSWRLDPTNVNEVILVGRVPAALGAAEETLAGSSAASQLWIKGIPGTGKTRTPLPGTGRQETWVRVYLPIK